MIHIKTFLKILKKQDYVSAIEIGKKVIEYENKKIHYLILIWP